MDAKFSRYDPADYLKSPEDIAAYLEAARAVGDPALIQAALEDVARAREAAETSRRASSAPPRP